MVRQNTTATDDTIDTTAIAAAALRRAADTVDKWVSNLEAQYEGTGDTAYAGPEETNRRAWNAAFDVNVESPATGIDFDAVEDLFADAIMLARKHDIAGRDAAEFYRNRAADIEQ